ncbi:MAG: sensor histidine kinase [Planctomycetota bacterium]
MSPQTDDAGELRALSESLDAALKETYGLVDDILDMLTKGAIDPLVASYLRILRRVFAQETLEAEFHLALGPEGPFRLSHHESGPVRSEEELPVDFEMQDFLAKEGKPVTFERGAGQELWIPLVRFGQILAIARVKVGRSADVNLAVHDRLRFVTGVAAAALQNAQATEAIAQRHRELAQERKRMVALVEGVNVGLLSIDLMGQVVHMNRNATLMIRPLAAVKGQPYDSVLPPAFAQLVGECIAEMKSQGFSLDKQISMTLDAATQVLIGINAVQLTGDEGRPEGWLLTLRDMTASKELERLRNLDKMKSDFVNNVSHELRTPLTSIKAYTEALQEMAVEDVQKNFLGVISQESDRLLHMIENLLNVSRIESGRMTLSRGPTQIMDILRRVVDVTRVQSQKHRVILEDNADVPVMDIDADKIMEVFLNIVGNAIKYSPKGGDVTIRPMIRDGNLEISVSDQGLGLSDEDCSRIFEQFYRVDSPDTATIGGTGLGLSITLSIVKAHGGVIRVTSKLGTGSTFTVVLPLVAVGGKNEIELIPGSTLF